jgi:tetratricopeptide (TPR) repeat protein
MISSSASRFAALVLACLFAVATGPVFGQDDDEHKGRQPTIDERTGKILNEAIEAMNAEKYNEARQALSKLNMERLSPYELSRTEQILAFLDYSQDKYASARSHYQKAIAAGGLSEVELDQVRYTIAQLYMVEEKWKEGAAALEEWFRTTPKPNAAAYYLLAAAYYQMGDHRKALEPAKKAVELADKPQESWLQLVLALYLQDEKYKEAIPYLNRLISMFPEKKTYWVQLSSIYGQLENYAKSLALMQAAYNAGLLTESSELTRLTDLLMYMEVPYRGAQVLSQAMKEKQVPTDGKTLEKLSQAWIAAREYDKAIEPLRRAAELSPDGNLYVRLGEVHVQREDWGAAREALEHALQKGKLKDTGNAHLMLGIVLFSDKKPKEARKWFERAAQSSKHGKTARGYIQLINSREG